MTPGVLLSNEDEVTDDVETPSPKRHKRSPWESNCHDHERLTEDEGAYGIPPHPLGVKPSGNAYASASNAKDNAGAVALLPDELVFQLLELLTAPELLALGSSCRYFYAFCRADELWRLLFVK